MASKLLRAGCRGPEAGKGVLHQEDKDSGDGTRNGPAVQATPNSKFSFAVRVVAGRADPVVAGDASCFRRGAGNENAGFPEEAEESTEETRLQEPAPPALEETVLHEGEHALCAPSSRSASHATAARVRKERTPHSVACQHADEDEIREAEREQEEPLLWCVSGTGEAPGEGADASSGVGAFYLPPAPGGDDEGEAAGESSGYGDSVDAESEGFPERSKEPRGDDLR